MKATDPFVLRPDVSLVPVRRLPADLRDRLDDDDAYAVTRRHSRVPSNLVDSETAALLEEFRQPATIVEAVLSYSAPRGADPEVVLEESFPLLARLVASQDLVTQDAELATAVSASLSPGDVVDGFTVVRCVQLLDDTEVYEVTGPAGAGALKFSRSPNSAVSATLRREAEILRRLNGNVGPRCHATGEHDSRRFVIVEWCGGVDSETAARSLREQVHGEDRQALLRLVREIVTAFARLHDDGVLHGDVHPNNVLVDHTAAAGRVRVIDFGLARMPHADGLSDVRRGGVGPFLDPDYAEAVLNSRPPPLVSPEAEQYSLAALVYFLMTGTHYCDFALDRSEMFRQITRTPPCSFPERGVAPWPGLESVLRRALEKDPERRFSSVAAFAAAVDEVTVGGTSTWAFHRAHVEQRREVRVGELLAEVGPDSQADIKVLTQGPTASLNYGAIGIALGLYRIASIERSPALLASADDWSLRAIDALDQQDAFVNAALEITPETVGAVSPFHARSGVFAVRALIDHAAGESTAQAESVRAFLAATDATCENIDLTLGRSGVLLAQSNLLEATRDSAVETAGADLFADLRTEIAGMPPIGAERATVHYLGIAHGWAGIAFAALRWCQASGSEVPPEVCRLLDELSTFARPEGDGVCWPVTPAEESANVSMTGWCHGSAGYVFLWTLASRMLGRTDYLDLAVGAARSALAASPGDRSLCCGLSGRAYSLLAMYRATGEDHWLDGAWALAGRALRADGPPAGQRLSLYKGDLGLDVLLSDLAAPGQASMPFFEPEGWPPDPL